MRKDLVMEVTCHVDEVDLDPNDRDVDGGCAVDGPYGLSINDIPQAATEEEIRGAAEIRFHETVPISCLEDFSFQVRPRMSHDVNVMEVGSFAFIANTPEPG